MIPSMRCTPKPSERWRGRWPSSDWISGYDIAMDADLLIHDAQYTDEEYGRCIGWGHSTYRHAFEFAARVGAKRIVPFHHDPSHDDETLDRLLDHALAAFKCPCAVSPGREGTTFELGS
jgi:ribonuclease BN (tRNA processing enzyme)